VQGSGQLEPISFGQGGTNSGWKLFSGLSDTAAAIGGKEGGKASEGG
jgi:hypothetical protein